MAEAEYVLRVGTDGVPIVDVKGTDVTFRLRLAVTFYEHDAENYRDAMGRIVPKAKVERQYAGWTRREGV